MPKLKVLWILTSPPLTQRHVWVCWDKWQRVADVFTKTAWDPEGVPWSWGAGRPGGTHRAEGPPPPPPRLYGHKSHLKQVPRFPSRTLWRVCACARVCPCVLSRGGAGGRKEMLRPICRFNVETTQPCGRAPCPEQSPRSGVSLHPSKWTSLARGREFPKRKSSH